MPTADGIGIDLIEIDRIDESVKRHGDHFLKRVFTEKERANCASSERLAGRFAAKEAVAKALGTGIGEHLSWQDIEIQNNAAGMPFVTLSKEAASNFGEPQILLSISHSKTHATAIAIWNKNKKS